MTPHPERDDCICTACEAARKGRKELVAAAVSKLVLLRDAVGEYLGTGDPAAYVRMEQAYNRAKEE